MMTTESGIILRAASRAGIRGGELFALAEWLWGETNIHEPAFALLLKLAMQSDQDASDIASYVFDSGDKGETHELPRAENRAAEQPDYMGTD